MVSYNKKIKLSSCATVELGDIMDILVDSLTDKELAELAFNIIGETGSEGLGKFLELVGKNFKAFT